MSDLAQRRRNRDANRLLERIVSTLPVLVVMGFVGWMVVAAGRAFAAFVADLPF